MSKLKVFTKKVYRSFAVSSEEGASMVIALLILLLLMGFATLVISRVSTETIITSNDSSENRAFAATMAHLESTTRDFADVFEKKLTPTSQDITDVEALDIKNLTTGFEDYDFVRSITPIGNSRPAEITGGNFAGLYALRDEYQVDITATDRINNVQTQLRRRFFNDRIPLFQFGIFFEDDLELNRPPLFTFGGRVHTNENFFISASPSGIYFRSKATAVGELVNDIWKTKTALTTGYDDQGNIFIADAGGQFRELLTGRASVNCKTPSGTNVFASNPNMPNCSKRSAWSTDKAIFQGNIDTNVPRLDLPLFRLNVDLIELVRRPKNVGDLENNAGTIAPVTTAREDVALLSRERFSNKEGIRISLADSQQRLPGCGSVTGGLDDCGVRLDRTVGGVTGYQPLPMSDGYQATRFNAPRFAQNSLVNGVAKQIWIKVELVDYDYNNNRPITKDVTTEFLSLGITERPPIKNTGTGTRFEITNYSGGNPSNINDPQNDDIRSIIKLQRFTIPGQTISNPTGITYLSNIDINGTNHNVVFRYLNVATNPETASPFSCATPCASLNSFAAPFPAPAMTASNSEDRHLKWVRIISTGTNPTHAIVPFPIQVYDTREGVPRDDSTYTNTVPTDSVTRAGVMSMIDIDVANLRKFFNGDFNGKFPNVPTPFTINNAGSSLTSLNVPEKRGWVLYVSDRRGDIDHDGQYDMEDVFPDGILQYNENVNYKEGSTVLDRLLYSSNNNYFEAPGYTDYVQKSRAATSDHGYYRRGVRLINGRTIPGNYDSANPDTTQGFTFASENGVYVMGNYNVQSVTLTGNSSPAPSQNYLPQGGSTNGNLHIPAAIVSDAVTVLSNSWEDARSFQFPYDQTSRNASDTQVRFAMLTGDGITGNTSIPYTPSQFGQLNGGIHNFKRYLERWSNVRLNYTGSLVNLFNSRNNNGFWKCCDAVYNPPIRDWTFDTTFLDPNRLPPGTPYIYSLSFTGFQRVNN